MNPGGADLDSKPIVDLTVVLVKIFAKNMKNIKNENVNYFRPRLRGLRSSSRVAKVGDKRAELETV